MHVIRASDIAGAEATDCGEVLALLVYAPLSLVAFAALVVLASSARWGSH